jgi:cation diffusion facilitator CzcD-associated flavoprotein CzcO
VNGSIITAPNVVLALGFAHFAYVPEELQIMLPAEHVEHTVSYVDFTNARGKRIAIVGGRQSAYEWAALLREAGAASVDVIHRHRTPRFAPADWSWTTPVVERIATHPQWFRELDDAQKQKVAFRLWIEGRSKLEPWLAPRIAHPNMRSRPNRTIAGSDVGPGGDIVLTLDNGDRLDVDQVVLATGYRTNLQNVPMLAAGNLLQSIETVDDSPVLDSSFQLSTPGLYATSMMATRDFGPLFAFTVAVRASSRIVGDSVAARL